MQAEYTSRFPQYGRTLVEMLGVLAIVGVLSIGGFAGYNRLMYRYKAHKQAQQLGELFTNIYDNLTGIIKDVQLQQSSNNNYTYFLFDSKLVPQSMQKNNRKYEFYDAFDIPYSIQTWKSPTTYHSYYIALYQNNSIGSDSKKRIACENAFKTALKWHEKLSLAALFRNGNYSQYRFYGDNFCTPTRKCLKDMQESDFDGICDVCQDSDQYCKVFIWLWQNFDI